MALNHVLEKPQKIVDTGIGLLEQELVVPNLFRKEGVDQFKGADDDTISVKVEGLLPFRDFAWRNGESGTGDTPANGRQKLTFDRYTERKVPITFGGNVYSAVEMTDEQKDFDFGTWTDKILKKQVKAVGRGLQRRAISTLTSQSYAVVIGDSGANLRGAILEARRVLNAFNAPQEGRYLVVGTDFEAALLNDDKLVLASNVSEDRAESALAEASIGRLAGFSIIVDGTIPASEAYAFWSDAFVMLTAAPSVPQSVKHGATQSFEGIAMRWLTDYSADYLVDRSVVNTYAGFRSITDNLVGWNPIAEKEVVSSHTHFVRGVKLKLDGDSVYPSLGTVDHDDNAGTAEVATAWGNYDKGVANGSLSASEELALFTGITGPGAHLAGTPTGTVAND